jgi:hypothetical protein
VFEHRYRLRLLRLSTEGGEIAVLPMKTKRERELMNIRTRLLIALTAAALVAVTAAYAGAAPQASTAAQQSCGTHKVVFKSGMVTVQATWRVSAKALSCGDAVKIVRLLAGKPLPNYRRPFPGMYAGLRCTGGPEGAAWARTIACKKAGSTKTITAVAN